MKTAQLSKALQAARGPYISIYVDDTHNVEDAQKLGELKWRAIREQLEQQGAAEEFITTVQRLAEEMPPPVGAGGRALVATEEGVIVDERLRETPPETVAQYSPIPHLLPLLKYGMPDETVVFAEVDSTGARISVLDGHGAAKHTEDETAPGAKATGRAAAAPDDRERHLVHKAHTNDRDSYRHIEGRTEEIVRRNLHETAAAIADAAQREHATFVLLAGETRSRTAVTSLLPEEVRRETYTLEHGGRPAAANDPELTVAVEQIVEQRLLTATEVAAERFLTARGRSEGLAVEGIEAVLAELVQRNVETLLLDDDSVPDVLHSPKVDALVTETLEQGGEVVPLGAVARGEGLELAEGVGAILRHRPTGTEAAG
jgi:hypothetical protein